MVAEVCGDHAHDGVRCIVHRQHLSDHVRRRSEFSFPESAADFHHRLRTNLVFFDSKVSPENGLHAENGEKFSGNHFCLETLRLAGASERENVLAKSRYGGKRVVHPSPVEEIGIGNRRMLEVGLAFIERHEPFRLLVPERRKQHGIHHAEDSRIRADAQRERENRNDCEARIFHQHSQCVSNVL